MIKEITERQEKLLNFLVREYIKTAEPISSELLSRRLRRGSSIESGKKSAGLDVSPATVRNDLQKLEKKGLIKQPHTSAGRVPTEKGYKYFTEKIYSEDIFSRFIYEEIKDVREIINEELELAEKLMRSLEEISITLEQDNLEDRKEVFEVLRILGPKRTIYDKNIDFIKRFIRDLESF